jgi:predicted NACHT family NTPase
LANSSDRKFLPSDLWTLDATQKFVILGAPGSGKTTLMSYFAVMLTDKQPQFLGLDTETD